MSFSTKSSEEFLSNANASAYIFLGNLCKYGEQQDHNSSKMSGHLTVEKKMWDPIHLLSRMSGKIQH